MEDKLSLAYGAAGKYGVEIITVTAEALKGQNYIAAIQCNKRSTDISVKVPIQGQLTATYFTHTADCVSVRKLHIP